jgi:hypothetical protein
MARWEYHTLSVAYDRKEHKDWVVRRRRGEVLVGLAAILESYGSDGWELVSLQPDRFVADVGFARYHIDPVAYRATFKRASE